MDWFLYDREFLHEKVDFVNKSKAEGKSGYFYIYWWIFFKKKEFNICENYIVCAVQCKSFRTKFCSLE